VKVSIGATIQSGPWGGGNQFASALGQGLCEKGVAVSYDLNSPDLDIILLIEPDRRLKVSAYNHLDILCYLACVNPRAIVVHRVNNSSEARSETNGSFNRYRIEANRLVADHTIFISHWLLDCYRRSGFQSNRSSVLLNGGDAGLWHPRSIARKEGPRRIVTHHWSGHANKGFDVYEKLDRLLARDDWRHRVEFTYVGRMPGDVHFANSCVKDCLSGDALVEEIGRHDIYLTAAKHEAAGMHHIEGALCGLPLLYRESGGLPEYCGGFGVAFTEADFENRLHEILENYDFWKARMKDYPHTSQRMCEDYFNLFGSLLERREELLRNHRRWRYGLRWLKALLGRVR